MSATPSNTSNIASGAILTSVNGGRRQRPITLKRKLQNRTAQRKYRKKQTHALEELKRLAAKANLGHASSTNKTVSIPLSDSSITPAQSSLELDGGEKLLNAEFLWLGGSDLPASPSQRGNRNANSFDSSIPHFDNTHFDGTPNPSEGDVFTSQSFPYHNIPVTPGPSLLDSREPSLSFEDMELYSTQALNAIETCPTLDLFGALPANMGQQNGVLYNGKQTGSPDLFSIPDLLPYDGPSASTVLFQQGDTNNSSSTMYLNERGLSLDRLDHPRSAEQKDMLEPFRHLSQLDNTIGNNQLIRLAIERKHEIRDIILAGFRAINSRSSSTPEAMPMLGSPILSDPYKNNLRLVKVATIDAFLSNAISLGMSITELYRDDCRSPFYHPQPGTAKDAITEAFINVPPHLKPTPPQILCPHHPHLDLIPFPLLRARAVALLARTPPAIDAAELKSDIMNDGLICWRTSGSGTAQPWDMRSWEAAPWFLKKWSVLVGGKEEEIWTQTEWWRHLRGAQKSSAI